MKKSIFFVLLLALILAFTACGETETTSETEGEETVTTESESQLSTNSYLVGFARANCMPDDPVPLAGYGNVDKRISTGFLDYLTISCTIITDAENNTIVLYSTDTTQSQWTEDLRTQTAELLGIPYENVFSTATHTHSAPSLGDTEYESIAKYKEKLTQTGLEVCQEAWADRSEATMYYNTVDLEGYNFVRHYLLSDGTYIGDNFGSQGEGVTYVDHATEENTIMSIVKFQREGAKDIYLGNWRVHPHITGGSTKYDISADIWAIIRQTVEEESDCHFVYYNGDAGNSNPFSRMITDSVEGITYGSSRDYKAYGKGCGALINACIAGDGWEELKAGTIKVMSYEFTGNVNHQDDGLIDIARQIKEVWSSTGSSSQAMALAGDSGIRSVYHAGSIIDKAAKGLTQTETLWVAQIGEIGITFAPNEQFVENGNYIRENSPYKYQLVFCYTNDSKGYIPSQLGYSYYCYEACTGAYEPGTGEIVASKFVDLLTELQNK